MTHEQKDLLLKDLCARLLYGVKLSYRCNHIHILKGIHESGLIVINNIVTNAITTTDAENTKPYLFPLSSMTEEQKYDFYCRFIESDYDFEDFKEHYLDSGMWRKLLTSLDDIEAIIDWFHKNHLDWRGLIPSELAIDATGLNIY